MELSEQYPHFVPGRYAAPGMVRPVCRARYVAPGMVLSASSDTTGRTMLISFGKDPVRLFLTTYRATDQTTGHCLVRDVVCGTVLVCGPPEDQTRTICGPITDHQWITCRLFMDHL